MTPAIETLRCARTYMYRNPEGQIRESGVISFSLINMYCAASRLL